MVVSVYRAIMGLLQKASGISLMKGGQCPYMSPMSLKSLLAEKIAPTLAKMLRSIFAILYVFTCTIFCPKPFVAKGFEKCDNGMQISTPYKTLFLLKPFINAYLAVSQFGMRHPKAVSHFVSFLGSNVVGAGFCRLSHSGKARQV